MRHTPKPHQVKALSERATPIQNWMMLQQGLTLSLLFTASILTFTVILQISPWLDEMTANQKFDNEVQHA